MDEGRDRGSISTRQRGKAGSRHGQQVAAHSRVFTGQGKGWLGDESWGLGQGAEVRPPDAGSWVGVGMGEKICRTQEERSDSCKVGDSVTLWTRLSAKSLVCRN